MAYLITQSSFTQASLSSCCPAPFQSPAFFLVFCWAEFRDAASRLWGLQLQQLINQNFKQNFNQELCMGALWRGRQNSSIKFSQPELQSRLAQPPFLLCCSPPFSTCWRLNQNFIISSSDTLLARVCFFSLGSLPYSPGAQGWQPQHYYSKREGLLSVAGPSLSS